MKRAAASYKILSLYLACAMLMISLPAQAWAMFLPVQAPGRQGDLQTIQKALESSVIRQRLIDLGLSPADAAAKINALSDAQIHELAGKIDAVQAGGDGVDALIFLLLVAIIVVVIIELSGHRVVVR